MLVGRRTLTLQQKHSSACSLASGNVDELARPSRYLNSTVPPIFQNDFAIVFAFWETPFQHVMGEELLWAPLWRGACVKNGATIFTPSLPHPAKYPQATRRLWHHGPTRSIHIPWQQFDTLL